VVFRTRLVLDFLRAQCRGRIFPNSRAALEFISKYQREDGKIPARDFAGASFVSWFKDVSVSVASADATPLYLIAVNDYA